MLHSYDGRLCAVGYAELGQYGADMVAHGTPDGFHHVAPVIMNLSSAQPANALIHIETTEGQAILTFAPSKAYQSVVLSSSKLKNGTTYIVYCGGRSTGTALDGSYTDSAYIPGTQVASYTVSSILTGSGTTGGGMPGGGFPGGVRC